MQGKVNYTIVGVFVFVLTAFLMLGIVWLNAIEHGKKYKTYLVYVHEDVTGLAADSPVRFNGVKVGYLKSLELDEHNPQLVRLELDIAPTVPVSTSTFAILNAQGVTGVVYVNLKAETDNAPLLTAAPGQPYPVIPSKPSLLMQLSTALPEITQDIQHLSSSIAEVLDTDNRSSIKDALKNIDKVTKVFADNSADFTQTMQSLDNALANVSAASDHFPKIVLQLNHTLDTVDQMSFQMKKTSETINSTMQSGQVVIRNFSDQVMPSAQQALSNLSRVTMSMQHLTDQLQRDPSMLVRGRQPALLGPGEK